LGDADVYEGRFGATLYLQAICGDRELLIEWKFHPITLRLLRRDFSDRNTRNGLPAVKLDCRRST
jgi:hypothetical protein